MDVWFCIQCTEIRKEKLNLHSIRQESASTSIDEKGDLLEVALGQLALSQANSNKQMQELMQVVANLMAQKESSHTETILKRQSLMPLPKFGGSPKEWAFF